MKKKILTIMCISTLAVVTLVGCGKTETKEVSEEVTVVATEMAEETSTEPPHEHAYAEEVTTPATCLEDGEATFTCECGDTYTEAIPATGHVFSNYVSNEDATYTADGTETATCTCGETDTRVAEGSMLTYTFEEMDATKYAKSTVNVRALPNTDGEKLGGLSTNDEVKVTGKCAETGWYRIEYSDGIAYVSDDYLVDEKVEVQVQASAPAASSEPFPYELLTRYVTPDGKISYFYCTEDCSWKTHGWHQVCYTCNNYNNVTFGHETVPGYSYETTMATFTKCDDMDGYIQTAAANGLDARGSVATPWVTADGKKIRAFCP